MTWDAVETPWGWWERWVPWNDRYPGPCDCWNCRQGRLVLSWSVAFARYQKGRARDDA